MESIFFYIVTIIYFLLTFWIVLKRWKKVKKAHSGTLKHIVYWFAYIALIVVSYLILLIIFFWIIVLATNDYRRYEFDACKWINEPGSRVIMVDDLIERRLLENKSRKEVINLLGKPESNDTTYDSTISDLFRIDSLSHDTDFIYELGAKRGMLQPLRFLEIWFKNDTVIKYKEN